MNSALQGVSSSPRCSQDLAGTFPCSCLFGIQTDDPKPRLVLLHPAREDSEPCLAAHASLAPSCWGAWESPPARLTCATGTPPVPRRQAPWTTTAEGTTETVRLNPSLQDTQLSRDAEASTRTDTCAWGGTGPRLRARPWPYAPWLSLSSSDGGKQRASSGARALERGGCHPLHPSHARVARAGLRHGRGRREQPARKECAVAWEGGDHGKGMCCATARAGGSARGTSKQEK